MADEVDANSEPTAVELPNRPGNPAAVKGASSVNPSGKKKREEPDGGCGRRGRCGRWRVSRR